MHRYYKKIEPPKIIMITPDGVRIEVNEYEWFHIRVQINKNKEEGWSWETKEPYEAGEMDKNGRMYDYPRVICSRCAPNNGETFEAIDELRKLSNELNRIKSCATELRKPIETILNFVGDLKSKLRTNEVEEAYREISSCLRHSILFADNK